MQFSELKRSFARVRCAVVAAMVAALGFSASAHANMINIDSLSSASTDSIGTFTGTIGYDFDAGSSEWVLNITLTNTSAAANGGYITGFIFNIDSSDPNAHATLISGNFPFQNAPQQGGSPFGGPYNSGAALGGSWNGGGSPTAGIGVGQTGSFTFRVVAADAGSLTAESFINGPFQYDFLVRFRGFNGGGSDKVPAEITDGPPVPGPTVLAAIAAGLVMMRRRQRTC